MTTKATTTTKATNTTKATTTNIVIPVGFVKPNGFDALPENFRVMLIEQWELTNKILADKQKELDEKESIISAIPEKDMGIIAERKAMTAFRANVMEYVEKYFEETGNNEIKIQSKDGIINMVGRDFLEVIEFDKKDKRNNPIGNKWVFTTPTGEVLTWKGRPVIDDCFIPYIKQNEKYKSWSAEKIKICYSESWNSDKNKEKKLGITEDMHKELVKYCDDRFKPKSQ